MGGSIPLDISLVVGLVSIPVNTVYVMHFVGIPVDIQRLVMGTIHVDT